MNKKLEILGLIPARGGSTELPGKNYKPLNGIPLIAYTILSAQKSKYISRLVVVTDSDDIMQVAKDYGAEVPFRRPAEVSSATSHAFEIYKYTVDWLEEHEGYVPDIVCVMLCTTPFRNTSEIDQCMEKMIATNCDWCFTVHEMEHHAYRAMTIEGDRMIPVFDVPPSMLWANRQELPKMYRITGGVIAARTVHIKEHTEYNIDKRNSENIDVRCVLIPQNMAYDINTIEDFEFVEMLMKKRGSQ